MLLAVWRKVAICAVATLVALSSRAQPAEGIRAAVQIATWNVSWLGHPDHPPVDDARQIENVAHVIRTNPAHVFALQEVSSREALELLLELLGPPFGGIISSRPGDQRLAVIFDVRRVKLLYAADDILDGHGDAYAGRPPLYVRIRLEEHDAELLVAVVHLKAFQDRSARERRYHAVQLLKADLDRRMMVEPIVLLGDFNDGLRDHPHPGLESTLRPFREDTSRYFAPSMEIELAGGRTYCADFQCSSGSVLDHVIVSRSLEMRTPEVMVLDTVLEDIRDYVRSTSDHLPVVLTLTWKPRLFGNSSSALEIEAYPNPFSSKLTVALRSGESPREITLHDLTGRVVARSVPPSGTHASVLETSRLPSGPYVLRVFTSRAVATRVLVHRREPLRNP